MLLTQLRYTDVCFREENADCSSCEAVANGLCTLQVYVLELTVRTVGDLPCAGRQVVLKLTVRKFLCSVPDCPRTMFTERLPDLVQSYARVTNRLRETLVALGLATSAEVSERVAPSLGMIVSAPTLLRRLRTVSCPPPTTVRILGVDDWAWKKSQIYGTLIVNLELGKPIELFVVKRD